MFKRVFSGAILVLLSLGMLFTTLSVKMAKGWSNGGYSSDPEHPNYGTHDWIAEHALDWLPSAEKEYIVHYLSTYLYGTELPDNGEAPDGIGDMSKHHIYYYANGSLQDDASAVRANTTYFDALNYYKSGNISMAVKTLGIMSHYVVDVGVFGHVMGSSTDWGAATHHGDYETYVNDLTNNYTDEFNSYLTFDGHLDLVSAYKAALGLAYDTTFDTNGDLTCVWMDENYNWNNTTFKNRAGESLNLAVNYLTDVLHRFYTETLTTRVQNINTGVNYTKIQDAINSPDTLNGHTIKVYPGIYYEHVTVSKSISLVGQDRSTTGIDGGDSTYMLVEVAANNTSIKNLTIENSGPWLSFGIFMNNTRWNTIESNVILNNGLGMYLNSSSSENRITKNRMVGNTDALGLRASASNDITENDITTNYGAGMWLWKSTCVGNRIIGNNITCNAAYAICFSQWASNNSIYQNNFINNAIQVYLYDNTTANMWDNGYPSGGNYWSDYTGSDFFRGANQDVNGSDAIGDTAYIIDANNRDSYPLMGPSGPSTGTGLNVAVFPAPDVGLVFQNVTGTGSTTVDKTSIGFPLPPGSTLVGQYYDIKTTAAFSGSTTIRIVYDDSNMTQEEERSLQLLQYQLDLCDVTGATGEPDGVVNMRDIGYFCSKFMTTPSNPKWDPRCDVTGPGGGPDGVVNMRDIGFACSHFQRKGIWIDITTDIDTDSNVIYGEASHLSMFGVTRAE